MLLMYRTTDNFCISRVILYHVVSAHFGLEHVAIIDSSRMLVSPKLSSGCPGSPTPDMDLVDPGNMALFNMVVL